MRQRQVAGQHDGDCVLISFSALDVRFWASMSGKCRKPACLEPKAHMKSVVLTCILLWLVICRRRFAQCLMNAVFENVPSSILQVCLVRPV